MLLLFLVQIEAEEVLQSRGRQPNPIQAVGPQPRYFALLPLLLDPLVAAPGRQAIRVATPQTISIVES